jgi:hypothetical protein
MSSASLLLPLDRDACLPFTASFHPLAAVCQPLARMASAMLPDEP